MTIESERLADCSDEIWWRSQVLILLERLVEATESLDERTRKWTNCDDRVSVSGDT